MDLDRGIGNETATTDSPPEAPAASAQRSAAHPSPLGPDVTTPILRRCTALAARARVDLLTESRHAASDELEQLLTSIVSWDPRSVVDPDPTMVVLAAAALQDLADPLPAAVRTTLGARLDRALELLHAVLDGARIDAMA
ncbi:hypothetical protein [Brachybacterium sp. YJGR34]|uniref:hypothetical protein n=1 Tax=Brachybacterium sp. YJGR34 TaxID=2059911 RepID=UPI000E0A7FA4|nr:hypothetical protein [Brachybacterium sp. YJGR34]